ncbi:alpha/beta fold hydrolase [Metabacillus niabensis]|uniref:alpha/beta fold hydrolase n=1 Tax=Metabacillus niabensis TaxID=324854 RepID=UPI001CFC1065|nr:alpha/beta hydrolase [Metabacillus niabensis]
MIRTIKKLKIEGVTMEYSIIGEGEPILVFHGGHSNCYEEFGYKALIERGFSLITPSRPGYGETSNEIGTSLLSACHFYKRLLDHLNIDKVHVLAISAGGPSGIFFAATYPENIHTLILQSAVTKEWLTPKDIEYKVANIIFRPKTERFTWKLISIMNNVFPQFIFKQMLPSFSTLTFKQAKDKLDVNDIEAIRKMNNRQRSGNGFLLDLVQINEVTIDTLKAVQCPTFIMHSKNDASVPLEHPNLAHENIPSSKLQLLDTWGHLIWLGKASEETDRNLIAFLISHKMT